MQLREFSAKHINICRWGQKMWISILLIIIPFEKIKRNEFGAGSSSNSKMWVLAHNFKPISVFFSLSRCAYTFFVCSTAMQYALSAAHECPFNAVLIVLNVNIFPIYIFAPFLSLHFALFVGKSFAVAKHIYIYAYIAHLRRIYFMLRNTVVRQKKAHRIRDNEMPKKGEI